MIKLNNNFIFEKEINRIRQMENISIAYPIDDVIVDLSIHAAPARVIDNSIVLHAIPLGLPINISSNKMEMDLSMYKHYVIYLIRKDTCLLAYVDKIAINCCSFCIFGKIENGKITVFENLKDTYYLSYNFRFHFDELEVLKWRLYEKINIYNYYL
jgi:hypothetical protein